MAAFSMIDYCFFQSLFMSSSVFPLVSGTNMIFKFL